MSKGAHEHFKWSVFGMVWDFAQLLAYAVGRSHDSGLNSQLHAHRRLRVCAALLWQSLSLEQNAPNEVVVDDPPLRQ